MKLTKIIQQEDLNKSLKEILKQKLYISNSLLVSLKSTNSIYINNISVMINTPIKLNDVITVNLENMYKLTTLNSNLTSNFESKFNLWDKTINILYEDDYLIIVDKESTIPVHPCTNNYVYTLANAVMNYLKKSSNKEYIYPKIHIITRLDKDTSGICIFAKNSYIQELFMRKKESIKLNKYYIAIVNNIVKEKHDTIYENISRRKDSIILREVNKDGSFAKTEYWVLKRDIDKNCTMLKILLHTRKNSSNTCTYVIYRAYAFR